MQRWLKFVKYLPSFGYQPIVYTPENPFIEIQDQSLLKDISPEAEVIKLPIWEPYGIFQKLLGKGKLKQADFVTAKKKSLTQKFALFIRGNFFIPDARVFWVRPSVAFLTDFIKSNSINTIITTGPPHSMHLIGLKLKSKNPSLKWIADFRDPWSEWGLLDSLKASTWARSIHRRLERRVLHKADEVITITPFYVNQFERLSGRKVNLLTNGFDEADFKNFSKRKADKFYLRHIGAVNDKCDPRTFMLACAQLCNEEQEIKDNMVIEFIGEVHSAFKEFVEKNISVAEITKFAPSVSHKKLIDVYETSAILVLILVGYKDAEGYMPGKLFEYLATGLPVLGIGPSNGDAALVLSESKTGVMFVEDDNEGIRKFIKDKYLDWVNSNHNSMKKNISKFSRREITGELVKLL